jgi:hypothetical protein
MGNINEIDDELMAMDSKLTIAWRQMPYRVPLGYFQDLATSALEIAYESEQPNNPSFGTKADVYTVPQGYFQQLPKTLLEQAKAADAKNAPTKRKVAMPPIRWALAASIALIFSIGAYIQFAGGDNAPSESVLSSIPATEISEYLANNYGNVVELPILAANIHDLNVETNDIEQYLNETGWE